ncbi:MAG: thiamine phosphate synthase [Ruminiclostridium sp.]|nr:thiamine phosphate synthase [Ruminiclostridium sp.]
MLDANLNRASEGLRVLEDIARFCLDNENLTGKIKSIRHETRKSLQIFYRTLLKFRDADRDVGPSASGIPGVGGRRNMEELAAANFKRVQEAFRSMEEILKVLGRDELSRRFEGNRYALYSIEKEFALHLKIINKANLFDTGIYCLTSEEHSNGRSNIEVVSRMLDAGIKIIQYREKSKTMLEKYNQCIKLRDMTAGSGAAFIINDNVDLARSVCADGVHLGQDDMPVAAARQILDETFIIGVSTHSPEQAEQAERDGADYIGVGPVFRTFTKKDVCEPVGLQYLDYAIGSVRIPFVAIGGIKLHNIRQVIGHGAKCIALVTEIAGADDIKGMICSIRKVMRGED